MVREEQREAELCNSHPGPCCLAVRPWARSVAFLFLTSAALKIMYNALYISLPLRDYVKLN